MSNQPIEEKWKIEKRALDLVCAIFYYGQFRAETPNEKELESILKELGRWPTSESACVQNTKWWEGQKSFIENLLEQERRRLTIKNAGLYRQLFGEMSSDKTFTAKEVWEIMNSYQPLFTREQEEEIKSIINK